MAKTYSPTDIFFDPLVDRDYYYTILPLLPLLYDHIYIYYPSDNWAKVTNYLSPTTRISYIQNLRHWISKGVIIPVLKGEYPLKDDIRKKRSEMDGPSEEFKNVLKKYRKDYQESLITLDVQSTLRGYDEARKLIQEIGNEEQIINMIKLDLNEAIPDLFYYYAGGPRATSSKLLLEIISAYKNDDWIRKDNELGEYLLPSTAAYQYHAITDLGEKKRIEDIYHNTIIVRAVDILDEKRLRRDICEWPEKDNIETWRELGLHRILRVFLHSQAISNNPDVQANELEYTSIELGNRLTKLRSQLPGELASLLVDKGLLSQIIICLTASLGIVIGDATSTIIGGLVTLCVGNIGSKAILFSLKRIKWDKFIDAIEDVLGSKSNRTLESIALAFGDVIVLGRE